MITSTLFPLVSVVEIFFSGDANPCSAQALDTEEYHTAKATSYHTTNSLLPWMSQVIGFIISKQVRSLPSTEAITQTQGSSAGSLAGRDGLGKLLSAANTR